MDLGPLMRKYREAKGLTQVKLAEVSGMSQQMIQKIEAESAGADETVRRIARLLEVPNDLIERTLENRQRHQVGAAMRRTPKTAANISRVAELTPPRPAYAEKMIPVMGHAAGALPGNGHLIMGEQRALVPCPPTLVNVEGAYAVYVSGTSMMPRYRPGELLFIHPLKEPAPGDYVVAQIEDETSGELFGYVKQFVGWQGDELVLSQHNPEAELRFPSHQVVSVNKIVIAMV